MKNTIFVTHQYTSKCLLPSENLKWKIVLWFNVYFILSGTQEENKTTYKLVNGGENALFFSWQIRV